MDRFNIEGKTALVTGCKRGIGFAMAEALAEAGADILGVSASLETSGSEIEKAVKAKGRKFKGYQCGLKETLLCPKYVSTSETYPNKVHHQQVNSCSVPLM